MLGDFLARNPAESVTCRSTIEFPSRVDRFQQVRMTTPITIQRPTRCRAETSATFAPGSLCPAMSCHISPTI